MAATFEIDSSRTLVKQFGKDRFVKRYLDYYIKERANFGADTILVEDVAFGSSALHTDEEERTRKVARLKRFSQLIPSKLWNLLGVVWLQD
jgi:hypothetical protein